MNEAEQAVRLILDAYRKAVFAKDVDALVSLYEHDARVFDLWGEWSYDGIKAWRGMVTGWFESLGDERVMVETDVVQIVASSDLASLHAFVIYKGMSSEGKELRAMRNRLTWTLRQKGGGWRISHEHTSAPVDPGTSKVILQP